MHLQSPVDTYYNKDSPMNVLYLLVYDQIKEKQKDFKTLMSFRGSVVSTGQVYKPLAEIPFQRTSWEHRRIFRSKWTAIL